MKEVKIVYYDPAGGEALTWAHGETDEELNEYIDCLCKNNNWNKKYVEIIAEREEDGRWCYR